MKIFAIRNDYDKQKKNLAFLLYYENEKKFVIEIPKESKPIELPLLISSCAERQEYTVDFEKSLMWVQQRIVPPDRQNIGEILKEHNMLSYDEYKLLVLNMGRCEQDDYYLVQATENDFPESIRKRNQKLIHSVIPLRNKEVIIFFENGKTKKVNVSHIFNRLIRYFELVNAEKIFKTVYVEAGGHGITWGTAATIDKEEAYDAGVDLAITLEDFRDFAADSIVNAAEAAEILHCSRQNINDLVKREQLIPLKKNEKNTLFLRDDIIKRRKFE